MPAPVIALSALIDSARQLARRGLEQGRPQILGIAGAPGAGKSTLAQALLTALGPERAAALPMDGFHLADAALERLGSRDRKGAPDTFDAHGFVATLRRVSALRPGDPSVWAPGFERTLEQPLAGALEIPAGIGLVITEGNYLLCPQEPWASVRDLLDQAWFVELPDPVRRERLVARHQLFGKGPTEARSWALGPDEANARLVASTSSRADLVFCLPSEAGEPPATLP